MTLSNWIQILGFGLVILTIVYKAGKLEQILINVIRDVDNNADNIKQVQEVQGKHEANLAVLNQATGVYR